MDPEPANIIPQLILILILTCVNAFFASAEMAIVSLNKNKLHFLAEEGNKKAQLLEKLLQEPTKFLSTIQVGITLAGFFSSASAATGISGNVGIVLTNLGVPYANQLSLVIVTMILSYITLVFGELFPKRVALQKAEAIAMFSVRPIIVVSKIALPFIRLLSLSTNLLIRMVGMQTQGLEEKVSREEIKSLVEVGQEHGVINETEKEMINSIIEFDDTIAEEVMTPRTKVYMINIEKKLTDYLDEMLAENYSRIPVFEGDSDNIIGILYMKDFMLEARRVGFDNVDVRSILHTPYFIPERKSIDTLFKELQSSKNHMAILIDEYGGFSGVVTIEDLIEEVMGQIEDEYDEEELTFKQLDANTFRLSGSLTIEELNDALHLDLDEDSDDYDTLGGFILKQLGHIPLDGEQRIVKYENNIFTVETVRDKRIVSVRLKLMPEQTIKATKEQKLETED